MIFAGPGDTIQIQLEDGAVSEGVIKSIDPDPSKPGAWIIHFEEGSIVDRAFFDWTATRPWLEEPICGDSQHRHFGPCHLYARADRGN